MKAKLYFVILIFGYLNLSCQKRLYCLGNGIQYNYRCTSPNTSSYGFDESLLNYNKNISYVDYIGSVDYENFEFYELILKRNPSAISGEKTQTIRLFSPYVPKYTFLKSRNNPSSYLLDTNQAVIMEDGEDEEFLSRINLNSSSEVKANLKQNYYISTNVETEKIGNGIMYKYNLKNITVHMFSVDYHYFNYFFSGGLIFPISKDNKIKVYLIEN